MHGARSARMAWPLARQHRGQAPASNESEEGLVARLRPRTVGEPVDFAALVQSIAATHYCGRVRFSGTVRARRVTDWAGLWLRVGGPGGAVLLDEVQRTPLRGTTRWTRADIVLDVPGDAQELRFGLLLCGAGTVDVKSLCLETVKPDVQVTDRTPWRTGRSRPDD
jgi:hypothetical protein